MPQSLICTLTSVFAQWPVKCNPLFPLTIHHRKYDSIITYTNVY